MFDAGGSLSQAADKIPPMMDALLAQLASARYGLVTRSQLIAAGFTDKMIRTRVARGWLEVVHPGVYRVAGTPRSWHQDMLAALLYVGGDAAASHRSAAFHWGLDGPFNGFVELSESLLLGTRPHGAHVHRSTDLAPEYTTTRRGIPVTKPARTLLDLGAVVRRPILDRAVDDALAKKLVTYEGLLVILDDLGRRGRRGTALLRASLAERTGVPESVLEAAFQRLVSRSHLPTPEYQYEVHDDTGRFVARVDAAYPDLRIAIELDGAATRVGREALHYDNERQNRLVDCGFLLRRYGWRSVVGAPDKTMGDLDRTIRRRRAELCLPVPA